MSTGEIVHRGLRYELMPVSMLIYAAVSLCLLLRGVGNRPSWSAVRVDAGEHIDFCRGFVLSTAERSRVTYFMSDKAYGRAAISQGDVGTR